MRGEMNKDTRTDKELVFATLAGELSAFDELVRRWENDVKNVVRVYTLDDAEANDVVQEAFIRAFKKLAILGPPFEFGAWVKRIGLNMAKNLSLRRARTVSLETMENALSVDSSEPKTDESVLRERIRQIVIALSKLSPPLRETTRLAYLLNYPQKEISKKLCTPIGTIKSRLWEARKNIKREVINMSRKGREFNTLNTVPPIEIEEIPNISMRVPIRGYGSYFGSVLEIGDVEVSKFYDYPGGILTLTARSKVIRKVNILGHECFEVLTQHYDCEPLVPPVLNYFEITPIGIAWILQITADEDYPKLEVKETEEIAPLFEDTSQVLENKKTRVVRLKVGNKEYGQCLAVLELKGSTPCERFYTALGRQVLHRRYVGPDAPKSSHYDYEELPAEPNIIIDNKEYRLWYDTVLIEP